MQVDNPKAAKLYTNLINDGYTSKNLGSIDEFSAALSDPTKADKIYNGLIGDGYTQANLGSQKEFMQTFTQPGFSAKINQGAPQKPLPINTEQPQQPEPVQLQVPTVDNNFGLPSHNQLAQPVQSDNTNNIAPKEAIQAEVNQANIPVWNKQKADYKEKIIKSTPDAITNAAVKSLKIQGIDPSNAAQLNKEKQKFQDQVTNGNATVSFDKDGTPGLVQNPGFFSSLWDHLKGGVTGWYDARKFKDMSVDERVNYANSLQKQQSPYIGVKPTNAGSVGALAGDVAPTVGRYAAGAAAGVGLEALAPETGGLSNLALKPIMSFVTNAGVEADLSGMNGTLQRYYDLKSKNPDKSDKELMQEAGKGEDVDRLAGIGNAALFSTTGNVLGKSVTSSFIKDALKTGADIGAKTAIVEGAKDIGHNVEGVTNKSASDIAKDMGTAFSENAPMGVLLHAFMGTITGIAKVPPLIKSGLKYDIINKMTPDEVRSELAKNVQSGAITPVEAQTAEAKLNEYGQALQTVPPYLSDEAKASVAGLIIKRNNLLKQSEGLDKTAQDLVSPEVDAINNQIKEVYRTGKPEQVEINPTTGETYQKPEYDNIAQQRVQDLAQRIASGKTITKPEDLQTQANFPKELETELQNHLKEDQQAGKEGTGVQENINEFLKQNSSNKSPTIASAVIEINGKTYEGKNHAEAILKAKQDGQDISQVDRQGQGKFKLSDGTIIDRAEAKQRFGQDRAELLIPQDEAAKQADKEYQKENRTSSTVSSDVPRETKELSKVDPNNLAKNKPEDKPAEPVSSPVISESKPETEDVVPSKVEGKDESMHPLLKDEKGNPITVYHGTTADVSKGFEPLDYGSYGKHEYYYFAKDKNWVKKFGKQDIIVNRDKFKIGSYHLDIKNPLDIRDKAFTAKDWINYFNENGVKLSKETSADFERRAESNPRREIGGWQLFRHDNGLFRNDLIKAGYDGLVISDMARGKSDNTVYVALNKDQIKSATSEPTNKVEQQPVSSKEPIADVKSAVESHLPKDGELKGVTEIRVSENGEDVEYGTKTRKTKISVKGLSAEDIKNEIEFEKKILSKSKSEAEKFNESDIMAMRLTLEEKKQAIKMHKQSLLTNEETEKIIIPFYEKHLELLNAENGRTTKSISEPTNKVENNSENNKKEVTGKEIEPHKEVSASKAIAQKEVAQKYDLKPMEASMLHSLKEKDVNQEYENAEGLKKAMYDKLYDKGFIGYNEDGTSYELSKKGNDFINAVDARLDTRKSVKSGTDLFPEDSNIPEYKLNKAEERIAKEQIKKSDAQQIIDDNGLTLENLNDYKHLFKGFPFTPEDFKNIKNELNDTKSSSTEPTTAGQESAGNVSNKEPGNETKVQSEPNKNSESGQVKDSEPTGTKSAGDVQPEIYKAAIPVPFAQEFIDNDVTPRLEKIGGTFKDALRSIVNTLSPKTGVSEKAITHLMRALGERNAASAEVDKVLSGLEKAFDKMKDEDRVSFIDKMKRGEKQDSPELDAVAGTLKSLDKDLYDAIAEYKPSITWKDNHFRVLWKVIPGSEKSKFWSNLTRRPLQGSKGFFKQATLADMSEGIEKGGVPQTTNPIRMFKLAYADGMKFVTANRMFEALKKDKMVQFVKTGERAPDFFVPINDNIAKVYFKADAGLVKAGEYYIEEGAGRLLNNHLSRDLIREHSVGKGLMEIKNLYTQVELGLSGFHAIAEGLETVSSDLGLGFRKLFNMGIRGDFKMAGEGIMDILKAPFSPKTTFTMGRNVIRFATEKEFENSDFGKAWLKKMPDAKQYITDFFNGGGLLKQSEDLRANTFQSLKEQAGKDNYIGAALRALPAMNEAILSPLFNHYIPALKVGMFFKEFPVTLKENEARLQKGTTTRDELARKTINFIDDRLGEMNFDNLFWNRTFKTATQFMMRSVTWKIGNLRAMLGSVPEQAQEFINAAKEKRAPLLMPKTAWIFGLSAMQIALSTVIMKMFTNKTPQNFKDIVAPQISPDDEKDRVIMPTYYKDMLHLWHSKLGYVTTSMSGPFSKMIDIWNNKDFYNYEIHDEHDSFLQKRKDDVLYFVPKPFSITSAAQQLESGDGGKAVMSFFGLNKAPGYLTNSDIENEIFDLYNVRNTNVKPKAEKEGNDIKKQIRELYKDDKRQEAQAMADKAVKDGILRPTQIKYLFSHAGKEGSPAQFFFKELPYEDKKYLVGKMTDEEKKIYDPRGKFK